MDKLLNYYSSRLNACDNKIDTLVMRANSIVVDMAEYMNNKNRAHEPMMATLSLFRNQLGEVLTEYCREKNTRDQLSDFVLSVKLRKDEQR